MQRAGMRLASAMKRLPWAVLGWLLVVALAGQLAALALVPRAFQLVVGAPIDALFVREMHAPEMADGRTYRWTRGESQLVVPGMAGATRLRLTLATRPGRSAPATVTVLANGEPVGTLGPVGSGEAALDFALAEPTSDTVTIGLRTLTFKSVDDTRELGLPVERLELSPLASTLHWPGAASVIGRLMVLVALVWGFLLRWWWRPRSWAPLAPALALVSVSAQVGLAWLLAAWPWVVAGLVVVLLAAWWPTVERWLLAALQRVTRPAWANAAVAVLALAQLAWLLLVAAQVDWVGHADYADNAVVARNLVRGRGYTVDYVAQFYGDYPATISHPSDVWPLLEPTLVAGSFLLFGVSTFASKLPNILAAVALTVVTYWAGRRVSGPVGGLIAALVVASESWFFENALFPVNDVPFTVFALAGVLLVERLSAARPDGVTRWRLAVAGLTGACLGLLVVSKPSGLSLVAGLGAWWAWQWWPWRRLSRTDMATLALAGLVAALLVLPLVGRNLATFGSPFYSLQSFDAWVTKWEPPDENIYRLMQADPPHPRRLVAMGYERLANAIGLQFSKFWADVADGELAPAVELLLAGLGVAFAARAGLRLAAGLTAAALPYALFVLVYWHYELRYFVWLIPWLAVFAAAGLCRLGQLRLAEGRSDGGRTILVALALALILFGGPRVDVLAGRTARLTSPAGDAVVGAWLAANTPPTAVVMTRVPWQITWHSERRTVMIPLAPLAGIEATMVRYGVDYVLVDRLGQTALRREALASLYAGRPGQGYELVHEFRNPNGVVFAMLYRVPARLRGTA